MQRQKSRRHQRAANARWRNDPGPLPSIKQPATPEAKAPQRDREADRQRFSDPAFNRWLDEGISDAGHTVWDQIGDVCAAWHGWTNRPLYEAKAEAAVAVEPSRRWIPVTERCPDYDEDAKVIGFTRDHDYGGVRFHHMKALDFYEHDPDGDGEPGTELARTVTHWMPAPWPPNDERLVAAPEVPEPVASVHRDTLAMLPTLTVFDGGAKLWPARKAAIDGAYVPLYAAPVADPAGRAPEPVSERYKAALVWALGAGDTFKPQGTMDGKYWWRGELAERAGLEWNGEEFVDRAVIEASRSPR